VIIIIVVHRIIIITYINVLKFIHRLALNKQLSGFILRIVPGGVTPRSIPYMTDVRTSDSLGVVRVPCGLNRSP
jgi:hypothetical protein